MVVGAGFQPALQTRSGREIATTKSHNPQATRYPLSIATALRVFAMDALGGLCGATAMLRWDLRLSAVFPTAGALGYRLLVGDDEAVSDLDESTGAFCKSLIVGDDNECPALAPEFGEKAHHIGT